MLSCGSPAWLRGLALASLAGLPGAAQAFCTEQAADRNLLGYFVGDYDLLGRNTPTAAPFAAIARARLIQNTQLQFSWRQPEGRVKALASIERCGGDAIEVLRLRFSLKGQAREAHCRFQSEFDNYPRISCRLVDPAEPGAAGGLLALFWRHEP